MAAHISIMARVQTLINDTFLNTKIKSVNFFLPCTPVKVFFSAFALTRSKVDVLIVLSLELTNICKIYDDQKYQLKTSSVRVA